MRKNTSLEEVRNYSKAMLSAIPIRTDEKFEFIVQHPFTSSPYVITRSGKMLDLRIEENYEEWIKNTEEVIDESDLSNIYALINSPWKLTWLKFVKPYLSGADFAEYLQLSWTMQENPNMDNNVSTATAIKWFKSADKKALMEPEDYEYWQNLPEEVTLYRGVSIGRKKYGISWTDDEEKALWFKARFERGGKKGSLLKVTVKKEHCLAYFDTRNEKEIVLDVNAVKKDIEEVRL